MIISRVISASSDLLPCHLVRPVMPLTVTLNEYIHWRVKPRDLDLRVTAHHLPERIFDLITMSLA